MRRDIVGLAAYASSRGLLVVLGTNGMLLSPSKVRELKAAGVAGAGISLDSLHPEKHDGFRGVQGAWKGAVGGIRNCVAQNLPVLLQMTVLPWNRGGVLITGAELTATFKTIGRSIPFRKPAHVGRATRPGRRRRQSQGRRLRAPPAPGMS